MEHYTILDFLLVSVPEEILLVFFLYTLLGKKNIIKPINIFGAGVITAAAYAATHLIFYPDIDISLIFNIVFLGLVVYFTYRLNYIEVIVGTLISVVTILVIQGASTNVILALTGYTFKSYQERQDLRLLFPIPELLILLSVTLILYLKNIKIFNLDKKKVNKLYSGKIRHIALQLTFMMLIIILNTRIFLFNMKNFKTFIDVSLLIMNFGVIVIFTVLVLLSAVNMGKDIQKEEELKRKIDGIEIIQNIEYINALMDKKEYDEVKNILNAIKSDIDTGMIKKSGSDRG